MRFITTSSYFSLYKLFFRLLIYIRYPTQNSSFSQNLYISNSFNQSIELVLWNEYEDYPYRCRRYDM